jgi:hypothetical protein
MGNAERFLEVLRRGGASMCDDCLAAAAGFPQRQTAFQLAGQLTLQRKIRRAKDTCGACHRFKNTSSILETGSPKESQAAEPSALVGVRPWYWEGNVQARIVDALKGSGHQIEKIVDTASREPGKDIIARTPAGQSLWVCVKGWPEKSQYPQARHWFGGAVLDLVLYREEDKAAQLAIGLPEGFPTYQSLVERTSWLRTAMPFSVYWVSETGGVRVQPRS